MALALPGGLALLGAGNPDAVAFEYRRPSPMPQLDANPATWLDFPRAFEAFFGDHYALRAELLSLRARLHWSVLGSSPSPMVVRGDEDWVYLTASHALANAQGKVPFEDLEVEDFVDFLERRSRQLADRGVLYLYAFVPEKSSVYPERLPWNYRAKGKRRVQQVMERARERGMDFVLDTTDAVAAEKAHDGQREDDYTFFPLGTHWTSRGAAAAAKAIVEALRKKGVPAELPPMDQLRFEYIKESVGDSWDTRLYLVGAIRQKIYEGIWSPAAAAALVESRESTRTVHWRRPHAQAGKLLVFHDSNGPAVQPILAPAFRESRWDWRRYDQRAVEEFRPDVVLDLFTERHLCMSLPYHDDPATQAELQRDFDRAGPSALVVEAAEWPRRLEPREGARMLLDAQGFEGRAVLAFGARDHYVRLDLSELEPGRDWILRLECAARSDGALLVNYPWTTGTGAYPVHANQSQEFRLASGSQPVYVHLARQRTGSWIGLTTIGAPRLLRLDRMEARALPPR